MSFLPGKRDGANAVDHLVSVPPANIDSLTGLRFIAALTIALGHSDAAFNILTFLGMPLFFTLSGFVIHYVYAEEFRRNWRTAIREFALARFSRIYPLYFCLFLFALVSTGLGSYMYYQGKEGLIVPYLFFFYTWWPVTVNRGLLGNWYYGISWSIPTEMFFYFAYALGLYKIAKIKTFKTCLWVLIGFCFVSYAWFYLLFISRDVWEPMMLSLYPKWFARTQDFSNSFYRWFLYFSPYSRIFEFIGGCLTCQLFLLARRQPPLPRVVPEALAWIAVAAIVAILAFVSIAGGDWVAAGNYAWPAFVTSLHMNFLLAPMCYALFFAFAAGSTSLGRVLGSPAPRFLGDISYSIYLGHPIAQTFAIEVFGIDGRAARVIVDIAFILLLAWGLYITIEVPSKRWLRAIGARYLFASGRAPAAKLASTGLAAAACGSAKIESAT